MSHGQGQDEGVRIEALPLKMQQAAQGQWQNKNIDQQQIKRK